MKLTLQLIFLLTYLSCLAQPDPSEFYPERIKHLTEELKNDSLNSDLLWERVQLQIAVEKNKLSKWNYGNPISLLKNDSIMADLDYLIDNNLVCDKESHYRKTKTDFLYIRGCYYSFLSETDKALSDFFQVMTLDTTKKFEEAVLNCLSEVYLATEKYDSALYYCDKLLEIEKKKKLYHSINCTEGSSTIQLKINILESWGVKKMIKSFYRTQILSNVIKIDFENTNCFRWHLKEYRHEIKRLRKYQQFHKRTGGNYQDFIKKRKKRRT